MIGQRIKKHPVYRRVPMGEIYRLDYNRIKFIVKVNNLVKEDDVSL